LIVEKTLAHLKEIFAPLCPPGKNSIREPQKMYSSSKTMDFETKRIFFV
jgi:hypothetical protein